MRYGWATIGTILAFSLTDCTVDRSGTGVQYRVWTSQAMVRSAGATPIHTTLTSAQMLLVGERQFKTRDIASEDPAEAETRLRTQWRQFLQERLNGGGLSDADRMNLGLGTAPFCLESDSVERTETFFFGAPTTEPDLPGIMRCDPLPPPPPTCGNAAGVYPTLTVGPPALAFAPLPLGSPAVSMMVTYANVGDGRLCLGTPMIDRTPPSHPDDFVVDASDCAPTTADDRLYGAIVLSLDTRTSCQVFVRFSPLDPGARRAELRASANDLVSRVPLTGTGIGGVLALSATSLCFNVPAASYGAFPTPQHRQFVTLSNSGPGAVNVDSVSAGGEGWAKRIFDASGVEITTDDGFPIAAGGSVQLRIFEAEGTAGSSTLIIDDTDDMTDPLAIPLLGFDSGCAP